MILDPKLILLVVLLVAVMIIAILIFYSRNKTEEERCENKHKLYLGIGIASLALIAGYILLYPDDSGVVSGSSAGAEYGIFSGLKETIAQKKYISKAKKAAKKAGGSGEDITNAGRDASDEYREFKRKGQYAERKAREDYRAANPNFKG